jgi:5-methylcytosine-specific restriction endonuclease McrA
MAKDKDYKRMIHTARWLRLRRDALTRHPLCRRCEEEGYVTAATEVHHVVPVENGVTAAEKERLMFDPSNLRPLCRACHILTHKEMGRCGKERNVRHNEEQLKRIVGRLFGDEAPPGGVF